MVIVDENLEKILELAARARLTQDSTQWKRNPDLALVTHADACDDLWNELYRLLDERDNINNPVIATRKVRAEDPNKELKKQILNRIKQELPSMIENIIGEF